MIHIQQQIQLKPFNTLQLDVIASHYVKINSVHALIDALEYAHTHDLNVLVLSGGSNMLLPQYVDALVIHMDIQGYEIINESAEHVLVNVGAGENWHEFVLKLPKMDGMDFKIWR